MNILYYKGFIEESFFDFNIRNFWVFFLRIDLFIFYGGLFLEFV